MKLALCLSSLFVVPWVLLPAAAPPSTEAATEGRWRPLGSWEPHWHSVVPDEDEPDSAWAALPQEVGRVAREHWLPGSRLIRVNSTWMPEGRAFWLLEADPENVHAPNDWLLLVQDPDSGAASARPIVITNKWIETERPHVRFVDLDDDGRDEIAIRQFDHNGTMWNADVVEYYGVLDDLSLLLVLRQDTDVVDLWSAQERGAIRSQLLIDGAGGLRCFVWRENKRHGIPRTPNGYVEYERGEEGWFRLAREVNLLGPEEAEQRYDWTIAGAGMHPVEAWERSEAEAEREGGREYRVLRPTPRHR